MFTLWYYNSWEFAMRNCVTAFKLVLFVAWQVNKSRDGLLGQGWQLYTEIQQNKKIVDCLAWSGCYFLCIEKKEEEVRKPSWFSLLFFFFFFLRQMLLQLFSGTSQVSERVYMLISFFMQPFIGGLGQVIPCRLNKGRATLYALSY